MKICFTEQGWKDYLYCRGQDKKTLKRINALIKNMQRNPFQGIGKPEPLLWEFQGIYSRRIDKGNRLIYMVQDESIIIVSCTDRYR